MKKKKPFMLPKSIDYLDFAKNCTKLMNEACKANVELLITKDGEPHVIFRPLQG